MVDRVNLTPEDRATIQSMIGPGGIPTHDQWAGARIALARSLQMPDRPNPKVFPKLPQREGGVSLHAAQLTGEGKDGGEDFTDAYRAMLSVVEGQDLFADEDAFHDALQRHVRRGLKEIRETWLEGGDLPGWMLQNLFNGRTVTARAGVDGVADLSDRVTRVLGQLGIESRIVGGQEGPRLTQLRLQLAGLDDLDRLRRGVSKIGFALGLGEESVTMALAAGERHVFLQLPRPPSEWRTVAWSDVRGQLSQAWATAAILPICLGTDVLGEPYLFDLADAPHMFVGGTTGSGKSMCLHAILLSLIEARRDAIELVLIDPKGVEFNGYASSPVLRNGEIVHASSDALAVLNELLSEMERRQAVLRALDARNILEANERGAKLKRIIVVLDELGDLIMTQREVEVPLIRLAQKARSAGIHLVLATQRPEAATFPGMLRSNIPSRIALAVQKSAESRIILDEVGAEHLLGRGDMLVRLAGQAIRRAHGCRIDPADIAAIVRSH